MDVRGTEERKAFGLCPKQTLRAGIGTALASGGREGELGRRPSCSQCNLEFQGKFCIYTFSNVSNAFFTSLPPTP
jgi:hypothetical protein